MSLKSLIIEKIKKMDLSEVIKTIRNQLKEKTIILRPTKRGFRIGLIKLSPENLKTTQDQPNDLIDIQVKNDSITIKKIQK